MKQYYYDYHCIIKVLALCINLEMVVVLTSHALSAARAARGGQTKILRTRRMLFSSAYPENRKSTLLSGVFITKKSVCV